MLGSRGAKIFRKLKESFSSFGRRLRCEINEKLKRFTQGEKQGIQETYSLYDIHGRRQAVCLEMEKGIYSVHYTGKSVAVYKDHSDIIIRARLRIYGML